MLSRLSDRSVFLEFLYNRRLPAVYRNVDEPSFYLKRYLQALIDGGYGIVLDDVKGFQNLVDANQVPEELLRYLIESFGLTYYPDIDYKYQRRIVDNVGELFKRRGTYAGVRYLAKVLTGMDIDLFYLRGYANEQGEYSDDSGEPFGPDDPGVKYGRYLYVTLLAKTTEQVTDRDVSTEVLKRYLKEFVPYYIDVWVSSVVAIQDLEIKTVYRFITNMPLISYNLLDQVQEKR